MLIALKWNLNTFLPCLLFGKDFPVYSLELLNPSSPIRHFVLTLQSWLLFNCKIMEKQKNNYKKLILPLTSAKTWSSTMSWTKFICWDFCADFWNFHENSCGEFLIPEMGLTINFNLHGFTELNPPPSHTFLGQIEFTKKQPFLWSNNYFLFRWIYLPDNF